jgi:ureidoacrylate peracid hydrolase
MAYHNKKRTESISIVLQARYDIILISDATASGIKSHYETTLARVRDYYGLQMSYDRFTTMINNLNLMRKKHLDVKDYQQVVDKFINEFGLLDFRTFREAPVQTA